MADNVEIHATVTPALHPQVVLSLEEYSEETAAILDPVAEVFGVAYQSVAQTFAARAAAATNPAWNEAAQVLETADLSDKLSKRAALAFDKVRATLENTVQMFEKALAEPVTVKAGTVVSTEIRAHLKGLDPEKRHMLIMSAINAGDEATVTSALGAPPYLSGLTDTMQKVLLERWHERSDPHRVVRLKAARAGLEQINTKGPLLLTQMEKAIGAPYHKVRELRDARAASEKHFILNRQLGA